MGPIASTATQLDTDTAEGAATALRTTAVIRERARFLLQRARRGDSTWFTVDDAALTAAAAEVADLTGSRFPDLNIPFHSRWRHFEAGGIERATGLDVHAMIDLTVVSVLLDAGAGSDWSYLEANSGQSFARSEGLAVASWHAFAAGLFSGDPEHPLRADAFGLLALDVDRLADAFQVGPSNPLVGLDGRVALLQRLGAELTRIPEVFGAEGRPGGLFDAVTAGNATPSAHDILSVILSSFAGVWSAHNAIGDERLGDCWPHPEVPGSGLTAGWMPFHKLSQWLTYSLLEPFEWAGCSVSGIDELTGLSEYRNGGLLLDTGVLRLNDPAWAEQTWPVDSELVVEWRALTVALLDELAPLVRQRLGVGADRLPLACILEGGTWATGRALAQRLRGGLPPLTIDSDGTVF